MKLIIAGSRTVWPTVEQIDAAISKHFGVATLLRITEVISGKAPNGADLCGERWAESRGIPVDPHPADWGKHGKVAGKLRNREMADVGDAAIVFWDGMSSGSCDMTTRMVARGKPVFVEPMKAGRP